MMIHEYNSILSALQSLLFIIIWLWQHLRLKDASIKEEFGNMKLELKDGRNCTMNLII